MAKPYKIPRKLTIGLTYTGSDEKHANYLRWVAGSDDIDIIRLEAGMDPQQAGTLDGVVLSGGLDMHPRFYNGQTGYPNQPPSFDEARDLFEIAVFENCLKRGVPVLGVCRGMQLVNCFLGGTMVQDIGPVANAIHRFEKNDKVHGIDIEHGTMLQAIAGVDRSVANSAHHQSIDTLGDGLRVNCRSDDNLIEGVEWIDNAGKSFFLGIQWHPERMFKLNLQHAPLTKNIRDYFIDEVKISIQAHEDN